jgi:hypothetical protein
MRLGWVQWRDRAPFRWRKTTPRKNHKLFVRYHRGCETMVDFRVFWGGGDFLNFATFHQDLLSSVGCFKHVNLKITWKRSSLPTWTSPPFKSIIMIFCTKVASMSFSGCTAAQDFSRNVKRWISSENYDMTDLKVPLECLFEALLSCIWKLFSNQSCSSSILVQSVVQTTIVS